METLLNKIYTDPGSVGSYGGVRHLLEEARKTDKHVSLNDVKNFLLKKRSYTLHKDLRRKFKKLKTTAAGIGTCAQCDLLDLSKFQDSNDGYNFLLVLIDVFSRVINVEPLRN